MALEKYIEKRNFQHTPEPTGQKQKAGNDLKFVVQRHDASHLHYDFRLEMEGVLKSWAVPKGPSLNPADKRLAMMVEDHPFDYRTFEGVIPEGNYGAGIVEIWDEGTYHAIETDDRKESEKKMLHQLHEGSLKFVLNGTKLKGEFALVKIKNDDSSKDNAWLLIKHRDAFATDDSYNSEDHVPQDSKIIKKATVKKKAPSKKAADSNNENLISVKNPEASTAPIQGTEPMPHNVKPMLAKLKEAPFNLDGWLFEIKWDGYRAIAEIEKGQVKLYSRNLLSFNHKYKPLVESLKNFGHDVVLDGEVVVLNDNGTSSFQMLQQYEEIPSKNLCYCIFDLLYLDGFDIRNLPLTERKKYLRQIFPELPYLKFSDHVEKEGVAFFELAKKNKLEGIMAKQADSPYRTGVRSDQWIKIKIIKAQEAIICGFTAPRRSRKDFGALVLGAYENGKLVYIGHTGGGFNTRSLEATRKLMDPLITETSPFNTRIKTNEKVTWVKPQLVCEISFSEWTEEGHMRQPIFQGLRIDKKASEVIKELPNIIQPPASVMNTEKKEHAKNNREENEKAFVKMPVTNNNKNAEVNVDGQSLKVTNLTKVYWPEEGYTKGDLMSYYMQISNYILPYLKDRPESLNRHPNGIKGENFFQKDMGNTLPSWILSKEIYSESNSKNINYMVCQDEASLIYMANLGCIEINPWNSRIHSLENPDYIVIDLDPGENTFDEVIETALVVKEVLDQAGAEAYCKTSGATGMHIYIPMGAQYTYDEAKDFAHVIAQITHSRLPELTSLERSPKDRRKQIYVDYLQNRGGQTLAAAYSVRPKPGATVSTPLEWKEVKPGLHPSQFTIKTIHKRLEEKGDLFKGIMGKGINMQKCLQHLGA